jgi:hypothetical protein
VFDLRTVAGAAGRFLRLGFLVCLLASPTVRSNEDLKLPNLGESSTSLFSA